MFKYYLLKSIRETQFWFWSLVFPLALMTCFQVAFGNIYEMENSISQINVAIIVDQESMYSENFEMTIDSLSENDKGEPFLVKQDVANIEEAHELLLDEKSDLDAVFVVDGENMEILLKKDGRTTVTMVTKTIANAYQSNYSIIMDAYSTDPSSVPAIIESISEDIEYTTYNDGIYTRSPDNYEWYYISTIIMALLFNVTLGIGVVSDTRADISVGAMRVSVSPARKLKLILSAFFSRVICVWILSGIHLLVLNFVFKISLGKNWILVVLFVMLADVFALAIGQIFGLFMKGSLSQRENKATGIVMVSVFLSGEMVSNLPGIIEAKFPILNAINPATILNVGMYRLIYFDQPYDFFINAGKILVVSLLCLVISVIMLRREKYASL